MLVFEILYRMKDVKVFCKYSKNYVFYSVNNDGMYVC